MNLKFLRIFLLATATLLFSTVMAQTLQDTGIFYISPMFALYTGIGTLEERFTPDIEIGKQWDVFSLGIDIGKIHVGQKSGKDTTSYVEIRPSLNVFQQGKFSNTLTIGIGNVFNAAANILTEFTTGIEYTPNKRYSYNVFFGTYYFSGKEFSSSQNFFGFSMMYFFTRHQTSKGLFNTTK